MSIIIILVVLGFFAVVALAESGVLDELSPTGVSNRSISRHLFVSFPNGFYTHYDKRVFLPWSWLYALVTLTFSWLCVNMPHMFRFAVIYTSFGILAIVIAFAEIIAPKKAFPSATCGLSGYRIGTSSLVLIGVLIGLVFVPLRALTYKPLVTQGGVMSVILVGWMVPIIEEGIFAGTVGPSAIERFGALSGIVVILVVWIGFHALAFRPLSVAKVAYLGVFRILAIVPLVKYKSCLPGLVGHIIANLSGVAVA